MKLREIPQQILRVIDDDESDEETRAIAIHFLGDFDYPLGEQRMIRLLSRRWNKIVYSVCEYIEYKIGILESEDIAKCLLSIMKRPDSISYFDATHKETKKQVDADVRYYAARCLALAELSEETEKAIVYMIRKKYPEVEDEIVSMLLNSIGLMALRGSDSRLWKRYSGKVESVFDRVDNKK